MVLSSLGSGKPHGCNATCPAEAGLLFGCRRSDFLLTHVLTSLPAECFCLSASFCLLSSVEPGSQFPGEGRRGEQSGSWWEAAESSEASHLGGGCRREDQSRAAGGEVRVSPSVSRGRKAGRKGLRSMAGWALPPHQNFCLLLSSLAASHLHIPGPEGPAFQAWGGDGWMWVGTESGGLQGLALWAPLHTSLRGAYQCQRLLYCLPCPYNHPWRELLLREEETGAQRGEVLSQERTVGLKPLRRGSRAYALCIPWSQQPGTSCCRPRVESQNGETPGATKIIIIIATVIIINTLVAFNNVRYFTCMNFCPKQPCITTPTSQMKEVKPSKAMNLAQGHTAT